MANGQTALPLYQRSKIGALENQWNNMPGSGGNFQQRFLSPLAHQTLNRLAPETGGGGGSSAFTVTDPRGVVHTFADQKSANAFKQAAGIK